MKLSAKSRYAARLLIALANVTNEKPLSTSRLSEETGVTPHFIEQIIRPLKKVGFISSLRGAAGGHMLAQDPASISLGDIIRTMEGNIHLSACLGCDHGCEREEDCPTRSAWERASKAMEKELDATTLADLLVEKKND